MPRLKIRIWVHRLHPMVRKFFPEGNTIFQDDNAPTHKAKVVTGQNNGKHVEN